MQYEQFPNGPDTNPKRITQRENSWCRIDIATDLFGDNGNAIISHQHITDSDLHARPKSNQPNLVCNAARAIQNLQGVESVTVDVAFCKGDRISVKAPGLESDDNLSAAILSIVRFLPYTGGALQFVDDDERDPADEGISTRA